MTEIFMRKQEIRPGKTDRLREWIAEMHADIRLEDERVRDIWAEETLQTISLFIEHADQADYFVWYLEADSIQQLVEAREASSHVLHEAEDAMMEAVLVDPTEAGDFEPLIHGVSPERPDEFAVHRYGNGRQPG